MRNFNDTFETRKRSYISAFSICMTVLLITNIYKYVVDDIIAFSHFQFLKKFVVPGYFIWLFVIASPYTSKCNTK